MFQDRELIIDSFAGGGGASTGIEIALGRSPDIAINHDAEALALHAANHPKTQHLSKNIWKVDPIDVVGARPVGLLWASPDCKHFSKAKGGKPVKRNIRDLAWVVVQWADRVRPRIIFLENVEEFQDWCPVDLDGRPLPGRKGETFKRFVSKLRDLGYRVEWRELRGCDYGSPTIRKRLFLIARCDGQRIVWPKPTHGPAIDIEVMRGRKKLWRMAADCIDWSLPCPSIFLTREEGKALGVKRPLVNATMARIAKGVDRYVIRAAKPFIVPVTHQGDARVHSVDEPLRTVTTAQRGEHALVTPFLTPRYDDTRDDRQPRTAPIDAPMPTITGRGNAGVLAAPFLVPRYGERDGQEPRSHPIDMPAPTIVPTANGGSLVAATIVKQNFGDKPCHGADEPLHAVTTQANKHTLVAAHLTKFGNDSVGSSMDEPMRTITANSYVQRPGGAPPIGVVAAFLAQHNGGMVGHTVEEPVSTIVQKGCTQAVVSAGLVNMHGADRRMSGPQAPVPTTTAGGYHVAEVRAFLTKYFGTMQDPRLEEPMHTQTTKERFGIVMVAGEPYEIADIGMRMLTPRELFRAQGFPDSYRIDIPYNGKPMTKTAQIRMCGNSVCPQVAAALVAANYSEVTLRKVKPRTLTALERAVAA